MKYERIKKKAYVRIITNMGQLNVELHSDIVPKTCENFLVHCQKGYYNGTKFHRSIKNFMVSGLVTLRSSHPINGHSRFCIMHCVLCCVNADKL